MDDYLLKTMIKALLVPPCFGAVVGTHAWMTGQERSNVWPHTAMLRGAEFFSRSYYPLIIAGFATHIVLMRIYKS